MNVKALLACQRLRQQITNNALTSDEIILQIKKIETLIIEEG